MEAFSKVIAGVVEGGFLFGFSAESAIIGTTNISHLFFANDKLFFCRGCYDRIRALRDLLCFEVVSRLKVSLAKSVVLVGNVPKVEIMDGIS